MSHPHKHAHGNHKHKTSKNALLIASVLLFGFAIIEGIFGWMANSLTLLSDAGHMVADGASLILATIAAWIASKPPSKQHSYGLGRAEVLGAWISSMAMVLIALFIGFHALERFARPQAVASNTVMLIGALGIAVNLLLVWILHHAEHTLNSRAAILHVLGDLLGSVAALISGIVIHLTGWLAIDPLLSMFIAILILISSINLLRETLLVLMEGVPLHLDLAEVGKQIANTPKVIAVHDLHIWTLSSGLIVLSAHIELDDLTDWQRTLHDLRIMLSEKFAITHVTLQPEMRSQLVQWK
ncbi:MAG TPA: cation diffusion facilitator family transporter [Gammaproteobacteria bacterium]|nr:cation diffusion facilitator family transporter [Gammaproteobacteria bacterium]